MNPNNQNQNPANKSNGGFLSRMFQNPTVKTVAGLAARSVAPVEYGISTIGNLLNKSSKTQVSGKPQQSMVPAQPTNTQTAQNNVKTQNSPWSNTNQGLSSSYNNATTAGTLAKTYNQQSPGYYANEYENTAKSAQDLVNQYAPRIATPMSQPGIGEMPKRLSDYERANLATQLEGYKYPMEAYNNLVNASLPRTMGPTDVAYNPVQGAESANAGAGNISDRVLRANAINQLGGQSQNLTGQQQQKTNFDAIGNMLMAKIPGTNSSINAINALSRNVIDNFSSQEMQAFKASLNSLAQMFPEQAKNITGIESKGTLKDKDIRAIKAFLGQIGNIQDTQIGTTQNTINNLSNTVNRTPGATGGFTNGGAF